jgi:hypothetical protein
MSNTADVIRGKSIAVWSQTISGVNAINPLVAFYDIHRRKREVLLFILSRTNNDISQEVLKIIQLEVIEILSPNSYSKDTINFGQEFSSTVKVRSHSIGIFWTSSNIYRGCESWEYISNETVIDL